MLKTMSFTFDSIFLCNRFWHFYPYIDVICFTSNKFEGARFERERQLQHTNSLQPPNRCLIWIESKFGDSKRSVGSLHLLPLPLEMQFQLSHTLPQFGVVAWSRDEWNHCMIFYVNGTAQSLVTKHLTVLNNLLKLSLHLEVFWEAV